MMKNRTMKMIVNGAVLAAMAALGIAAFQLGTAPLSEPDELSEAPLQMVQEETVDTEEDSMVDVGNHNVEAELDNTEENLASAKENEDEELTASAEGESQASDEETVNTSAAIPHVEVNFSEDTLMEWPVNGTILVDYSMDQTTYFPTLDQYRLSPAISVQAVEGAPVMAAANGTVYSIEENAQTGTTVTMELGNGYQAVYGQLTDLNVAEGDTIKEGAIIGYIGSPTKYYSVEGSNLYFAMKKDGEAIDPIAYLP